MAHCNILLEKVGRIYFAGEMFKGTVELQLDRPKKFRGLYFKVYGYASCQWSESQKIFVGTGSNGYTTDVIESFKGKDVYLNTKTYLFGYDGANAVEKPSGVHRYKFSLQLPSLLPASVEASYGHIRYEVEAILDIPWSFDKKFKLPFTVVRSDDLNLDPRLRLPYKCEDRKTFCCQFCNSELLMMTVSLPCTGFAVGQNIPLTVKYFNQSYVDVVSTKLSLKRIIRYVSEIPSHKLKLEEEEISDISVDGVKAASTVSFQKHLCIPQLILTSNDRLCNVLQVTYEVKIEAIIQGCGESPILEIPITIGTIPIDLGLTVNDPSEALPRTDHIITTSVLPPPYTDDYLRPPAGELPPPTFEEALKMNNQPTLLNHQKQRVIEVARNLPAISTLSAFPKK